VWRALTTPDELVAWDERILAPVQTPVHYPESGQHVQWRYRLGTVQLVMHDRPLEVQSPELLRRTIRVGSLRYEQTFSLQREPGDPPRTRLSMKTVASNSVPVVGDVVDRFEVRRMTAEHVDETLRSVRAWCEQAP
jgi:uncharacterized protein YndB with AHSA1/START domain